MTPELKKLFAIRSGGAVQRFHAEPWRPEQRVAEHTYNMILILWYLFRENPQRLLETWTQAVFHDTCERWTGDLPAPVLWNSETLHMALHEVEEDLARKLDLPPQTEAYAYVKAADTLESLWTCIEDLVRGNLGVIHILIGYQNSIRKHNFEHLEDPVVRERVQQLYTVLLAVLESLGYADFESPQQRAVLQAIAGGDLW